MTSRTAFLLGALIAETGVVLALVRGVRTSSAMNQDLATKLANHHCPDATVRPDFAAYEVYEYTPGKPLVQPPPMQDKAIARSPITLGRS